jgi:hypothetical protein
MFIWLFRGFGGGYRVIGRAAAGEIVVAVYV